MKNAIHWFEIMATDFDRACKFYEAVMAIKLTPMPMDGGKMAMFPAAQDGVGGAIWHDERSKPSLDGTVIYLHAEGLIDTFLSRLPAAGGSVLMPKTPIGPYGFIALIKDSEGNRIGFHSMVA